MKTLTYEAELLRNVNNMLHPYWATGDKITLLSQKYEIGKMSYGDYFIEPVIEGKIRRETDQPNEGTIWPYRMEPFELEGLVHTLNALRK